MLLILFVIINLYIVNGNLNLQSIQGHTDENWPRLLVNQINGSSTPKLLSRYKTLNKLKPGIRRYNIWWNAFEPLPSSSNLINFKCQNGFQLIPSSEEERIKLGFNKFHCYSIFEINYYNTILKLDKSIGAIGAAILYGILFLFFI